MDEDELLYREMNPEDGFYMGDEEYEEVEYEEEVPEETGTREISIFSDEYMAMLDARIAELEAQAAARKAAENRYAALRNKRAAENSQPVKLGPNPVKPEEMSEKPPRKSKKKQLRKILRVLLIYILLFCGVLAYCIYDVRTKTMEKLRNQKSDYSQEDIFTPPVRDTTTDVKYIGPDGEIVGEEKASTIKADYSLPAGYRDGYEDGYEDGCNHERGGSYAPRQRGSKYRADYAEGYAEGYYDGFQDMAEDYDAEGVYDEDDGELD